MFRALIIDDERKAREGLRMLLNHDREVEVEGECKDGLEAIELITAKKPDIIFLDIQMPEVSGFDVLNSISFQVPAVIFTTAYDHYALKAFELHAIDYLLKPFTAERFYKSLNFVKNHLNHNSNSILTHKINELLKEYVLDHKLHDNSFFIHQTPVPRQQADKFAVKIDGKIVFIEINEVRYIEALDTYVKIHTKNKFVVLKESMKEMERRLTPAGFIRTHRSYLINSKWLTEIEPYFNGDFYVKLSDGSKLKGSRNYREAIEHYLR